MAKLLAPRGEAIYNKGGLFRIINYQYPMMTSDPIHLLINVLIAGIIVWAAHWFLNTLGLPEKIRQIVVVIIAVVALFWLLRMFGLY